jgi:hypothetical protein
LFIELGSPWENGYNKSFNGKLRDELLNGEIFYTLVEARVIIERWRVHYNTKRPHTVNYLNKVLIDDTIIFQSYLNFFYFNGINGENILKIE